MCQSVSFQISETANASTELSFSCDVFPKDDDGDGCGNDEDDGGVGSGNYEESSGVVMMGIVLQRWGCGGW